MAVITVLITGPHTEIYKSKSIKEVYAGKKIVTNGIVKALLGIENYCYPVNSLKTDEC